MFLLLFACARDYEVQSSQTGCTDFDYNSPADPELLWDTINESTAMVYRTNVLRDEAGATFVPEYLADGNVLSITESWVEPASADTFCYQPEVTISGITSKLEVRWFTEDELDVPFATAIIEL